MLDRLNVDTCPDLGVWWVVGGGWVGGCIRVLALYADTLFPYEFCQPRLLLSSLSVTATVKVASILVFDFFLFNN